MRGRRAPDPLLSSDGAPIGAPRGEFVVFEGEEHYRIAGHHRLAPFLTSVPSDSDLWMFVASGGGLTAGRVDPDGSLFPYVTVDRLHVAHHHTGPLTLLRIPRADGADVLWEPFAERGETDPAVERNLYKNTTGNRLVFEETNHEHELAFRYAWAACDDYGWVRTATLVNRSASPVSIVILDGLRNVLPWGAPLALYQQASVLVDAYKTTEADPETGLGTFALTAGITDRAEALEVLRANTVWCCGLEGHRVHLSLGAVAAFRRGQVVAGERRLDGASGNYLVSAQIELAPRESRRWRIVADSGRDHLQIAALRRRLREDADIDAEIDDSLQRATTNLRRIVGSADGLQVSGRREASSHHFANVLYNTMRGGAFVANHDVDTQDLRGFLRVRNRVVTERHERFLAGLPATLTIGDLRGAAAETGDPDLRRLVDEYLPLFFGRRHGDPSRPWNRFSIHVRDDNGNRRLYYEGNWRDIFQNWEALCTSFPGFLPNVVAKFVNASTVDGFNPYRITRRGVDWEVPAPDDPWSNIGYWGDHQIIYLLRLLEALRRYDASAIGEMLGAEIFSYAEVPYRIKPYAELVEDPRATIAFDAALDARITARVADVGTDGRLLTGPNGAVYHANLLEKLLVPALSKLSNLIPDAGIWMNTQRPEWNDANNALAGGGVSVVTLCHLRRYLDFLAEVLADKTATEYPVSAEVWDWFAVIADVLAEEQTLLATERLAAVDRKRVMDRLGAAFSAYREGVYARGFSAKRPLAVDRVVALCRSALAWADHGIAANRCEDGLFHTYNLLEDDAGGVEVGHLQVMLEGQVAALSAGVLTPEESLTLLERLFASDLYRPDQHSFTLYPARVLPGFLAKNVVPAEKLGAVPLLQDLLAAGDRSLVARDVDGVVRFAAPLRSAGDVAAALDILGRHASWRAGVERDRAAVLALFDDVFGHKAYTGRSGVMYAYEGLGCIYWHMVAKLLLAAQECLVRAEVEGAPATVQRGLAAMYRRIRAGLGYEKSVDEYGAFPTDPYSHTPPGGGAKQPGMTGQVKEEVLTRLGELGVRIKDGTVQFAPDLLEEDELLGAPAEFHYFDVDGKGRSLSLAAGALGFTLCQVPVVYKRATRAGRVCVEFADGAVSEFAGDTLASEVAAEIFARSGRVGAIRVDVPEDVLGRLRRD